MQNLQNKYCELVPYVIKSSVGFMTTTVKLASFVEIYFFGWIFQAYRRVYIFVDKHCSYIWHEFVFAVENILKIFGQ